jgi:hypothetical protein
MALVLRSMALQYRCGGRGGRSDGSDCRWLAVSPGGQEIEVLAQATRSVWAW